MHLRRLLAALAVSVAWGGAAEAAPKAAMLDSDKVQTAYASIVMATRAHSIEESSTGTMAIDFLFVWPGTPGLTATATMGLLRLFPMGTMVGPMGTTARSGIMLATAGPTTDTDGHMAASPSASGSKARDADNRGQAPLHEPEQRQGVGRLVPMRLLM
jgi:hypothetical protein